MALDLVTYKCEISAAITDLHFQYRESWLLLGYESTYSITPFTVTILSSGNQLTELLGFLSNELVLYAFIKLSIPSNPNSFKIFLIYWVGSCVSNYISEVNNAHFKSISEEYKSAFDQALRGSDVSNLADAISQQLNVKQQVNSVPNDSNCNRYESFPPNLLDSISPLRRKVVSERDMIKFKIAICGDTHVGKSYITEHFIKGGKPIVTLPPTINTDILKKIVYSNGFQFQLEIWDTAGQEIFRSLTKTHFRDSNAIFVIYDITNMRSYESLDFWVKHSKMNSNLSNVIYVLVGNKMDLHRERVVSIETARSFAKNHQFHIFYEVSALTGQNIFALFDRTASEISMLYLNELEKDFTASQPNSLIDLECSQLVKPSRKCCSFF